MEGGRDYVRIAETYFPGGCYGNGAAMRVAPVGLFFRDDQGKMTEKDGAICCNWRAVFSMSLSRHRRARQEVPGPFFALCMGKMPMQRR